MTLWNNIMAGPLSLLFLLFVGSSAASGSERIAVLISLDEPSFQQAVTGFQSALNKQGVQAIYDIYQLNGEAAKTGPAIQKIKKSDAKLILALGSLAAHSVLNDRNDIPLVVGLVLRTDSLKKALNATGVGLEYPMETQIRWAHRLLPEANAIGVIFNPKENRKRIEEAEELAKTVGLRLEAQEVSAPQDIPAALRTLSRNADALWVIADTIVLSPQIAKNILLFSFRNNIPLIGPSATWVKAGALYALDWDFTDIGAQCGELAARAFEGVQLSSIPPMTPRRASYSLNISTARQLKVELTDEIIRGARNTY
jgi:putative ABC transport system substrate-binding protein